MGYNFNFKKSGGQKLYAVINDRIEYWCSRDDRRGEMPPPVGQGDEESLY